MKVVIDTSIIIDYLRGGNNWKDFITAAEKDSELYLPTIAIFELFSGDSTKNPQKLKDMIDFINQFQRIDLDEKIAKKAGEIYRDTRIKIQVPDYIIAASALELGAEIVTLNIKHFQKIPGLILYRL